MNSRWARLVGMTAIVLLLGASSAVADDELGLSPDGTTWSSSLPHPLFDPEFRWVPGDIETASFHVRNQSTDDGLLAIEIRGERVDSLLETGDLFVSTRAGAGDWVTISEPGTHALSRTTVAAGAQERVDVRVSFDPASTNRSQVKQLRLRFDVRLTQTSFGAGGSSGSANGSEEPTSRAGLLPGTGAPQVVGLVAVGLLAMLCGAWLAHRREVRHG